MSEQNGKRQTKARLLAENEELRLRLEEAEETLEAIRYGEVDALVVVGPPGEQIYTLTGAEHVYRVIVETMNEAAVMVDASGTILFCNQRFCDLMKTSIEDVVGHRATAFAARPQQLPLRALLRDAEAGPLQRRLTLRAADGTAVPVQLSASLLQTDDNKNICLVATDLSELEASANSIRVLREHQQALEESEARFRTIFEASQDAVVIANSEGVCVQANPAVRSVFGLAPEELTGWRIADFLPEEADFSGVWATLLTTGQFRGEMRLVSANGSVRCVESYAVAGILPERHLLVIHDITERKQAEEALLDANEQLQVQTEELRVQTEELRVTNEELSTREGELRAANEALRESEQRLRRFYESGLVGVMYWRMDGAVVDANDKFLEMTGYSREDLAHGKVNWMRITPPEYRPLDAQSAEELKATGVNSKPFEKEYLRRDGTRLPVIIAGAMLDEARVNGVAFVLDNTERKRAEEALRETRDYLDNLLRYANAPIIVWDPQYKITRFNHASERLTGRQAQEVLGQDVGILFPPDRRPEVLADIHRMISEGQRWEAMEIPILHQDGSIRTVLWNSAHVLGPDNKTVVATIAQGQDITERKQAEEALRGFTKTLETRVAERTAELEHRARQLQRLTLELSEAEDRERRHLAEILHDDLQQQLAAAKFHLSLLSNRAKHDPSQQMMIGQIDRMLMDAIQKSRSLSHELSPAVLYQSGLTDALSWLAEQIKTKHGLMVVVDAFGEVSVESDALKTFLYRTAQELLFNVVKHARVNQARIRLRCLGRCICLSVSDRGRGFDPQGLREATGFGLLSIRERVELLGGRMTIHSAPGHGATFHIVVPDGQQKPLRQREMIDGVSLESPMVALAAVQGSMAALHEERRLRVLLADDHEIVREGLASLLQEEAGIEVVGQAANGREAVDLADRLRPDVVVMDVAMPLINGDEATRQIKMHLPGTRVVALSMYQEADLVERMHRAGAESYVLKTAPAEELLAAIRGPQSAHAL